MLDQPQSIELIRHIQRIVQIAKTSQITAIDVERLCDFWRLAAGSFRDARPMADGQGVAVMMNHTPRKLPAAKNPRFLDPLFFAAALLMCLPGGMVRLKDARPGRKLYYFPRYEHPASKSEDMRIYLTRIIIDAPEDKAVKFIGDHHDWRLGNLRLAPPIAHMREPKLGREAAVAMARKLFEENTPDGLSDLSADGYEALLRDALETATAYHGKREA